MWNYKKEKKDNHHFPSVLLARPNMSCDDNELEDAREDKDHTHLTNKTNNKIHTWQIRHGRDKLPRNKSPRDECFEHKDFWMRWICSRPASRNKLSTDECLKHKDF